MESVPLVCKFQTCLRQLSVGTSHLLLTSNLSTVEEQPQSDFISQPKHDESLWFGVLRGLPEPFFLLMCPSFFQRYHHLATTHLGIFNCYPTFFALRPHSFISIAIPFTNSSYAMIRKESNDLPSVIARISNF